ncbi:hypothetical protein ACP275_08G081200 [Erythranthe tilingii]
MAASARIFNFTNSHSLLLHKTSRLHAPLHRTQHLRSPCRYSSLSLNSHNHSSPKFLNPHSSFNSFPVFRPANFSVPDNYFDRLFFGAAEKNPFHWNFAPPGHCADDRKNGIAAGDKRPEAAVVMLGWLGAQPKHLKKYIELYNNKGIHAVTFVASVRDVLSFDLGKKLEERIQKLARELASWLSDETGRDRVLIFHTFSNTGWLAYGAILNNLKDRQDLLEKIKGCVVDSGGDPNLDPKVWAAGFTTALLKKSSSATYPSTPLQIDNKGSKIEEKEPFLIETFLLFAFEKLFSSLLNLPNVNPRLTKVISGLSKNQPACPQLYLYSAGDKVIPFRAVELFIEEQRKIGKRVSSFNFGSSPHVDHYRTFPDLYASQIDYFLKDCLSMVGKL